MLNSVMKKSWVLGAVVLFLGFLIIIGSFVVIPAGSEGVVIQFGAVTGTTMQQGLHFKLPFVQSIVKMDIRTQKYTADGLTAASKDLQNVTTNIAINFKLDTT